MMGSDPKLHDYHDGHRIMTFAGHELDISQPIWRFSATHVFDTRELTTTSTPVTTALNIFARHLVANYSPDYVVSQLRYLKRLTFSEVASTIEQEIETTGYLGQQTLEGFKGTLFPSIATRFHSNYIGAFIRWYVWCTDIGLDVFDADIAARLEAVKLGTPPRGEAVMRQDPQAGPLRKSEYQDLEAALRSQAGRDMPLVQQAVAWLFLAFGTNPKSLSLLAEDDLIVTHLSDGSIMYELRIPRIKKRTADERAQFRTRRLIPALGSLLERLIEDNRSAASLDEADALDFRPLLRASARKTIVDTMFHAQRFRMTPAMLANMMADLTDKLNLKAYDGSPLRLTPRRLRYTFATKLVADGASPQEVADALDHSDTGYVMVYFNTRSDVVQRLDKAMGLALAPIAQAFMGVIVDDETGATRARDRNSRIKHYSPTIKSLENVGSCGSFGFCGLMAPIACYTCTHFQAWLDGPHEHVLDELERKRNERLAAGADPKMTQIHDRTMLAVAEVIVRCAARRDAEAAA